MGSTLDREMGGQPSDEGAITGLEQGREPGELPETGTLPPDLPIGGALGGGLGVQPAPVVELMEDPTGPAIPGASRVAVKPVVVDPGPGIWSLFQAWALAHKEDLRKAGIVKVEEMFTLYLQDVLYSHAAENQRRPPEQWVYDFEALHVENLSQLMRLEAMSQRKSIWNEAMKAAAARAKQAGAPKELIDFLTLGEEM